MGVGGSAMTTRPVEAPAVVSSGVPGLDFVLGGGLAEDRVFLVEGSPGTGKTTLALQFLLEGVRLGEPTLYVTLAETRRELEAVAASHGWDISGIEIFELAPADEVLDPEARYTVFHPSDVELDHTVRRIYDVVERLKPLRVVIDSLSEMRILAQETLRLRRQVLGLKHFFTGRKATVLLLDDLRSHDVEPHFASIAHGVIMLEQLAMEYGGERRRLRIAKMRGQRFRGGYHDFAIHTGGVDVFPRLIAAEHEQIASEGTVSSGNPGVDSLLGGGLEQGSCTLLAGPAGVGKTVLTTEFALAAAERGDRVIFFLFDERRRAFLRRAEGLGIDVAAVMESGNFVLRQLDPTEVSPGQFARMVVDAVEQDGANLLALDSLTGYLNAMPGERLLHIHLHELFSFLGQRGVTSLITLAQQGPIAQQNQGTDLSYLADAMILLRYFEAFGQVRQAMSVLKKRSGPHEQTIREFRIQPGGIAVGEPLRAFQGVLTGVPLYSGGESPLLDRADHGA